LTSQNQNGINDLLNIYNQTTPAHQLRTNREPKKTVHGKIVFFKFLTK